MVALGLLVYSISFFSLFGGFNFVILVRVLSCVCYRLMSMPESGKK